MPTALKTTMSNFFFFISAFTLSKIQHVNEKDLDMLDFFPFDGARLAISHLLPLLVQYSNVSRDLYHCPRRPEMKPTSISVRDVTQTTGLFPES